ncbi:hypothetical protein [Nocardioides sp. AN3]
MTDSPNEANLTPVCFSMKSMHTCSLARSRPRWAKKTTNRSSTA